MNTADFKALVECLPTNSSGCKLWPKGRNELGYGKVSLEGFSARAHRASYAAFKGKIPDGFSICHKCDCPPCVNPDHLFAGSHAENMLDMAQKGRARTSKPEKPFVPTLKTLGTIDPEGGITRLLYMGRLIEVHFDPYQGWHATIGPINILNPWTKSFFRHHRNCLRNSKFYVKHGFYPGMKPSLWRKENGLANIS